MKKGKYKVFVDGHNQEVEAYAVDIPDYGVFIVHRMPDNGSFWKMSEPTTGYGIGQLQKTKKAAIEEGTRFLSGYTVKQVHDAVRTKEATR